MKFKTGDKVYFIVDSEIQRKKVEEIVITEDSCTYYFLKYPEYECRVGVKDKDVLELPEQIFKTKKEAVRYYNDIKNIIIRDITRSANEVFEK